MDKISSIINSSKNKVDMSKERPVRAGAPSFGQPISPASQTFQKIQREDEMMNPLLATTSQKINSPEVARHSGIIDKITLSFRGNAEKVGPTTEQVIDLSSGEIVQLQNSSDNENSEYQGLDLYA